MRAGHGSSLPVGTAIRVVQQSTVDALFAVAPGSGDVQPVTPVGIRCLVPRGTEGAYCDDGVIGNEGIKVEIIISCRDSGRTILTKDTDSSPYGSNYAATGTNPLSPKLNESAAKSWNSFVVDGNGDKVLYHFSLCGKSDGNTVADEKITFSVTGGTVVIFGINLSGYRVDEQ